MNTTTTSRNLPLPHPDDHRVAHLAERTFAKIDAMLIGIVLVFLGFGGMVYPDYAGLHMTPAHIVMLMLTGAVSFYEGVLGTIAGENRLGVGFAAFYLMLALAGFAFGADGRHTLAGMSHGQEQYLLRVVPGCLEFGVVDHLLHAGLAALFMLSALLGWLSGEND